MEQSIKWRLNHILKTLISNKDIMYGDSDTLFSNLHRFLPVFSGEISKKQFRELLDTLIKDGYVTYDIASIDKIENIEITLKGKEYIKKGGYNPNCWQNMKHKSNWNKIFWIIIAIIITGIINLIVSKLSK